MHSSLWTYKCRVVYRGDQTKDEDGDLAVFSAQRTGSLHLYAPKFCDAIARMPGNSGGDSDASGAYTQLSLKANKTSIAPPRMWWTPEMEAIKAKHGCDPVVELKVNLYGHPKAGLYWEGHCHDAIRRCGFEKVENWECLFKHYEKQLFLSVYVDDFKMGGKAENVAPMWEELGMNGKGTLILDPPTPLTGNVYLGSEQRDVENDEKMIVENQHYSASSSEKTIKTANIMKVRWNHGSIQWLDTKIKVFRDIAI